MSGNEFACSLGSSSAKISWVWTQKTCWKTLANNTRRYSSRCVRALKLQSISFASLSPSMSEDLELQLMNLIFRGIYVAVDIYCSSQSQISLCLGIYDLNKYFHRIYALSKYTHLLSWPLESAFAWQEGSKCARLSKVLKTAKRSALNAH